MTISRILLTLTLLIGSAVIATAAPPPGAPAVASKAYLLSSFEPGGPDAVKPLNDATTIVQDQGHASQGSRCAKVESKGDGDSAANGLAITDPAALARFKDYPLFKFDVFNPQTEPLKVVVTMSDTRSRDRGTRYNNDCIVAAPGRSTIEINLSGLNRSNAKGNTSTDLVDPADLKKIEVILSTNIKGVPIKGDAVLYFDNFRLEGSDLPIVEGLKAISFGGKGTPVYPGFVGCTDKNLWDAASQFGWIKPGACGYCQMPDPVSGGFGSGEAFKLKLPNGKYEIQTCFDCFGIFGAFPIYHQREVFINGGKVLSQTMTGPEFLDKIYYAHEDDEDLSTDDLWEKFIAPRNKIYTFPAEVTDGTLTVEVKSPDRHGGNILFLVVYPESRKDQGRQFMDALNKERKEKFNTRFVIRTPVPTGEAVVPTADDQARGYVPFVRHTELDIGCNARPAADERKTALAIEGAAGQRCGAQVGLYPLEEVRGLVVDVSDLRGPDNQVIPASALSIKKIRNFFKRPARVNLADLQPYILQDFSTLDLKPGLTRGLWLTLTIPGDVKPGAYAGRIVVHAGDKPGVKMAIFSIDLTVLPFTLDKVTDIALGVTGSRSYGWRGWYDGLEDTYWKGCELVVKDLADHGMNCVNAGPNAKLTGIKDGKAIIDYTDMDRWLDMAVKAGLTKPADTYGGLDIVGMPRFDSKPGGLEKMDQQARETYGVPFLDLLKIVCHDFDQHFQARGYPRHGPHILDEPRPEWSNVESAGELIKVFTAACPNTLFSGYYSTGQGRDGYFQTMPLSITHVNELNLKLTKEAGKELWEYNGQRVRYNIGRWCYVAARAGMTGYLRNGYMYVDTQPYFDFSDDEASWCVVYPSRHGINSTVGWERTAEGVTDYRYLAMCQRLINEARARHKAQAPADAAEAYMKETLKGVQIEDRLSADLSPEGFDRFRHALGGHIAALTKALAP